MAVPSTAPGTAPVPSASWTFPAVAENVSVARRSVTAFAKEHQVPEPCRGDLRIAVTEIVANAVVHAFRDRPAPGAVTVSARALEDRIEVVVRDDGDGMAARSDSPGMGVGLPLVRRIADEMDQREPPGGGSELWMCLMFDRA
jgi:serine/threonine-protein kinase RsbW